MAIDENLRTKDTFLTFYKHALSAINNGTKLPVAVPFESFEQKEVGDYTIHTAVLTPASLLFITQTTENNNVLFLDFSIQVSKMEAGNAHIVAILSALGPHSITERELELNPTAAANFFASIADGLAGSSGLVEKKLSKNYTCTLAVLPNQQMSIQIFCEDQGFDANFANATMA